MVQEYMNPKIKREYDELDREEIVDKLNKYRRQYFSYVREEDNKRIKIMTKKRDYDETKIKDLLKSNKKLEFGNKKDLESLAVLDILYMINSKNGKDIEIN